MVIHSPITSVSPDLLYIDAGPVLTPRSGKLCDCKSLHWVFEDNKNCRGLGIPINKFKVLD